MTRTDRRRACALLMLAGCHTPDFDVDTAACSTDLAEGEVFVGPAPCDEAWPADGQASSTDLLLANHWLRAALHHPALAQTIVGTGGGTLIDAAPTGWSDRLFEAVPLIDGGWLDVDEFEVDGDSVIVGGSLRPLPGLDDVDTAARGEVRWTVSPDGPWLELEGADGLWLHVQGAAEVDAVGTVRIGRQVYAHDGVLSEDLGGAVVIEGLTRLIVADAALAWATAFADGQALEGEIADGDELWLFDEEDELMGMIPLDGSAFDTRVPDSVARVRASGDERGLGPALAPGTNLELEAGPSGSITVVPDWQGAEARPLWLSWRDEDGRSGRGLLSEDGGTVREGAGTYSVTLDGGPSVTLPELLVEVEADGAGSKSPQVTTHFEPDDWVLAQLDARGSQSRSTRWSNGEVYAQAAGRGVRYLVMTPEDVIAETTVGGTAAEWVRGEDGTELAGVFRIWTWPRAAGRQAAGGALDPRDQQDPALALDASIGQIGTSRHSMVDLAWLQLSPPPYQIYPHPDLVRLESPGAAGPAGGAWDPWFTWLDGGADLFPAGPLLWTEVPDANAFGAAEVERGVFSGAAVATTGPLLIATVDGLPAGSLVEGATLVDVELRDDPEGIDRVGLIADGELRMWGHAKQSTLPIPDDARWMVVAAWSTSDPDRWAVTAPFWLESPGGEEAR